MEKTVLDQLGREVILNHPPKRIVSLVPSQTELLYDLGLEDRVVGITKFCVHPDAWYQSKKRIGGTKSPDLDLIDDLYPDLIIANKEENLEEHIVELAKKYPVWVSDVQNIDDALDMIGQIAQLVGEETQGRIIADGARNGFNMIKHKGIYSVAYLIWRNPYMTVGGDTFINSVLNRCGLINVFADQIRYPQTLIEEIKYEKPDFLFLSSEPFPFKEEHIAEFQKYLPDTKIRLVDGEMFSWYGSRLLGLAKYWNEFDLES